MGKKILGILFFISALLILVGSIANGSLFKDMDSIVATYGNFFGIIFLIILYIFSGIFFIGFDNPMKMKYIDGFKKRSKQSIKCVVFIVVYLILFYLTVISVCFSCAANFDLELIDWVLNIIVATIPYSIPFIVFLASLFTHMLPHNMSKKYFVKNDANLSEYLSINETFNSYSGDNFVLASNKALYFPSLFCVIPFNQISSIKMTKELWLQYVYFYLPNGKKFYITTKHFDHIQEAINANKQTNQ